MRFLLISIISFFSFHSIGQVSPVKWDVSLSPIKNGSCTITATANIDEGWQLYSQYTDPEGPVPTNFTYKGVEPIGSTEEITEAKTTYSELFELEVSKFKDRAVFTQEVKIKPGTKTAQVAITFMCCDDLKCLPPTEAVFDFKI